MFNGPIFALAPRIALALVALALVASGPGAPATSAAAETFTPAQIANLQLWLDPSQAAGVTQNAGAVSALNDLSGHANSVVQTSAAAQPAYVASGINNLGSLTFGGKAFLLSASAFSGDVFNESTVFVVTNQANETQDSSVFFSGLYDTDPHFGLKLSEAGASRYDLNDKSAGRLTVNDLGSGPALWTALGSLSTQVQQLRKNGNLLRATTGPAAAAYGAYPLAVGAIAQGGKASSFYDGEIGETLVYNRALSGAEAAEIEGYLACKWGLQNRLPANHPYRTLCPQGGSHASLPLPAPGAGGLVDPPQLRSANRSLTLNVFAKQSASGAPALTYNGSPVPPTLRLLAGDTLNVNLTNGLPTPPAGAAYLNDTSLHYHGLHVSPNAPADDSIDMLAMPGQALHYTLVIPATHPSGLYWYHSHAHGEAERQNLAGMSGALIIDGIAADAPQVGNLPERILIVRDAPAPGQGLPNANRAQVAAMFWAMRHAARSPAAGARALSMRGLVRGNTTAKTRDPYVDVNPNYRRFVRPAADSHCLAGSPETAAHVWTLNGQSDPSIGIRPGERQFWRLVNAASDSYLDLALDNALLQIVALDGLPLTAAGSAPLVATHYLVPPGGRLEFIVIGPPAATTAYLRTRCFDAGSSGLAMPAATLATINAASSLTDDLKLAHRDRLQRRPGASPGVAARPHASIRALLRTQAIARTQTFTYSSQEQINGQSYDPGAPPQFYAQSGTLEQWQIVNVSSQVHTFHIHQTHFLVKSIVGGTAIEQSNVGQELDDIDVPAATANGPGSVTLVVDFTDPAIIGTFLFHCHILAHEDAGMMAKVRVGTAPPLVTNAPVQGLTFAAPTATAQTVALSGGQTPYSVSGCTNVANASVSAATVTVAPAGAGDCVLAIADASGLSANVAIAVAGHASPVTVLPSSLAFASPGAAAQSAAVSGGTPPYSVTGCANVATASIAGTTLAVWPAGAGTCSLTVGDAAKNVRAVAVAVNAPSTGTAADTLTFHNNNARQGWNARETVLTNANVNSSAFGKLAFLSASGYGKVYAQPLFAGHETIAGATHNVVIVATATDQMYAYDDTTLATLWHRSFTNAVAGITQQSWSDIDCADVNPDIGIVATPVIDRALDRVFVVVPTKENGTYHMRLHAVSLQSGLDAIAPVEVSASALLAGNGGTATTSAEHNFSRAALLEANGSIYVALGSHCDAASRTTHGWVLAYSSTSLAPAGTVINSSNGTTATYLGVPWMSGYGPAADTAGNVYFSTGNGPWDGINNFSQSDIKVPGNLDIANGSYFTPIDQAAQSNADADLGSGGLMLLPDGTLPKFPHAFVQGGKSGQKYLLNADHLGGQQAGDAGAIWQAPISGDFGGPAFFSDAAGRGYVIYGNGAPLSTYYVDPTTSTLDRTHSVNVPGACLECRDGGSQPVVSSNGTVAGTTLVWALQTPGSGGGAISLLAFDAATLGILYTGAAGTWTNTSGASHIGGALISPLVANGKVYVPTDGGVAVFGLK